MKVPTISLRAKNGDIYIYNASDVYGNPTKFADFEVVGSDSAAVVLDSNKFATADDYIKPEWPEKPITARADDPPMTSTKKRGRPAKGV